MKKITQDEALEIFKKTPFPNSGYNHNRHGIINVARERRFFLRFMTRLNDLAKKRGYRLFGIFDTLAAPETSIAGDWILSNIETISQSIIDKKKEQ